MKKLFFSFLFLLSFIGAKTNTQPISHHRSGKDIAVFFAVDHYQSGKMGNLQNPIKNARDIASELKNRFAFETEVLENPTQNQIINKLKELERLYARNEDGQHPSDGQLMLFFSGHGMSEDENGYFLPSDADPAKPYEKGIAYEIWRPKINKINCRHILVVIDACYSVRFDPDWHNRPDGQFKRPGEMTDSQRALANFEAYKSRVFFTSDNKEDQTPDRSNFAKKLLEGLRSGIVADGYLTSSQLFANHVQGAIPHPRAGTFGDDEASSTFLFYDKTGVTKTVQPFLNSTETDDRAFEKARTRNSAEAFKFYLEDYPAGKHIVEAQEAIKKLELEQKSKESKNPSQPGFKDPFEKKMILVNGGVFKMGSEVGNPDEKPVRNVKLSDFYIGKYEVTCDDWYYVLGEGSLNNPKKSLGKNLPVTQVSWNSAQVFINTLNEKSGKNYRLPTEAEWEFAAKGGLLSKGFLFAGSNDLEEVAQYGKRGSLATFKTVGLKKPNELGLYDMIGNVAEWCSDWYLPYPENPTEVENPTGPDTGNEKVIRGGSAVAYKNKIGNCTDRNHASLDATYPLIILGLRLVHDK